MNIKWDVFGYTKQFQFVHQYGEDVLTLLDIKPSRTTVLDLGCGNGVLTRKIADMGAEVIGIDASADMIAMARRQHPGLNFKVEDALNFSLQEPVDAIFSNAVFHWIEEQDRLVQRIVQALKIGGQLVCEFGGKGCVKTIHDALQKAFAFRNLKYQPGFYFPTIGEYAPLLERHGLQVVYATLFDRITALDGSNGMKEWIRMFIKKPFQNLEGDMVEAIIAETVETIRPALFQNGSWCADYVRIRLKAIKIGKQDD